MPDIASMFDGSVRMVQELPGGWWLGWFLLALALGLLNRALGATGTARARPGRASCAENTTPGRFEQVEKPHPERSGDPGAFVQYEYKT